MPRSVAMGCFQMTYRWTMVLDRGASFSSGASYGMNLFGVPLA